MSWALMSAALARAIRLLALLAVLLGGVTSHEVAMAGGSMHGEQVAGAVHHENHHAITANAHDTCGDTICEKTEPPCCVMGQCLLGITASVDCAFAAADLPDPEPSAAVRLRANLVSSLYRPPVLA